MASNRKSLAKRVLSGFQVAAALTSAGAAEPALAQNQPSQAQVSTAQPSAPSVDQALYNKWFNQPLPQMKVATLPKEQPKDIEGYKQALAKRAEEQAKYIEEYNQALKDAGSPFARRVTKPLGELLKDANGGNLPTDLASSQFATALSQQTTVIFDKTGIPSGTRNIAPVGASFSIAFQPANSYDGKPQTLTISPNEKVPKPGDLTRIVMYELTRIAQQNAGQGQPEVRQRLDLNRFQQGQASSSGHQQVRDR